MPSSHPYHISQVLDWLIEIKPGSVLDIGIGFGKWGFLAREYLDVAASRYEATAWRTRIDGVEAFRGYATPIHDYIYDSVYYGDIRDVLPRLSDYDVVVVGDVIEHFTKEEGLALLRALKRKSKFIIVSSPTVFFQQESHDNPFETHRSLWTMVELEAVAGHRFEYEEFYGAIFAALLQGDLATERDMRLDSWPSRLAYAHPWLRSHPKLARLAKSVLQRLPRGTGRVPSGKGNTVPSRTISD